MCLWEMAKRLSAGPQALFASRRHSASILCGLRQDCQDLISHTTLINVMLRIHTSKQATCPFESWIAISGGSGLVQRLRQGLTRSEACRVCSRFRLNPSSFPHSICEGCPLRLQGLVLLQAGLQLRTSSCSQAFALLIHSQGQAQPDDSLLPEETCYDCECCLGNARNLTMPGDLGRCGHTQILACMISQRISAAPERGCPEGCLGIAPGGPPGI